MLTQEKVDAIAKGLVSKLQNSDSQVRNVPLAKGDKLTFKLSENMLVNHAAQGNIGAWDGIVTENGVEVSTTQLLRKNNGLPLAGNTVAERFASFCAFLGESDGVRTISIADVRTRELIQSDGTHSLQRTILFNVV